MILKAYYEKRGGHYHVDIFSGKSDNMTFGLCGQLVFDEREWDDVRNVLQSSVRFIPRDNPKD